MGDVFICDEVVKHLVQDIVDTTGLWGLSKPLENFFWGGKKAHVPPCHHLWERPEL